MCLRHFRLGAAREITAAAISSLSDESVFSTILLFNKMFCRLWYKCWPTTTCWATCWTTHVGQHFLVVCLWHNFYFKNVIPVKKTLLLSLLSFLYALLTGEEPQVLPTTLYFYIPFELFIWWTWSAWLSSGHCCSAWHSLHSFLLVSLYFCHSLSDWK